MDDFEANCHLCGDQIIKKQAEDGSWPMFNQDDSPHEHLSVSVSKILEHIHYRDGEDKTKTIGEWTIQEFEERVSRLASKEAAMKLGSFLHATNGFVRKKFPEGFIKKTIVVNDKEYFITGHLDGHDDDIIIEAKFTQTRKRLKNPSICN